MEEPSEKPAKTRNEPYLRKPPGPVTVNYRMAYTATVSLVNDQGEALVTRRHAIEASDSERVVVARAMADVRHYLTQRRDLLVPLAKSPAGLSAPLRGAASPLRPSSFCRGFTPSPAVAARPPSAAVQSR